MTPVGTLPTQDVEKVIGELNPPTEFTIRSEEVLRPCVVEIVDEEGFMVKSGAAATVTGTRTVGVPMIETVTGVECATPPPDAVTSRVKVPVEGAVPAFKVNVEVPVPPAGTTIGLGRLTVTSAGAEPTQDEVRSTSELKPFTDEMIKVVEREAPGFRFMLAGDGCVMKSGETEATTAAPGTTFNVTLVECEIAPLVAVTVTG